jgi:hypothetical protein
VCISSHSRSAFDILKGTDKYLKNIFQEEVETYFDPIIAPQAAPMAETLFSQT